MDVDLDIVHPGSGLLSENDEGVSGGLVAIKRYDSTEMTQAKLNRLTINSISGDYLLYFPNKVKVWKDKERTQPVVSGSTSFSITTDHIVYIEGVTESTALKDVELSLALISDGSEIVRDTVPLTVVQAEFDVIVKIFIPYQWVTIPHLLHPFQVALGDDRDYDDTLVGTFRVQQLATVIPYPELSSKAIKTVSGQAISVSEAGVSKNYLTTQLTTTYPQTLMPAHSGHDPTNRIREDELDDPHGEGTAPTDRMHVDDLSNSGRLGKVRLHGAGADPIILLAADIDWDFTVTIDGTDPINPSFSLTGVQDGFPAYEIYVKTVRDNSTVTTIYQWKPPLNRSVEWLFPGIGTETIELIEGEIE